MRHTLTAPTEYADGPSQRVWYRGARSYRDGVARCPHATGRKRQIWLEGWTAAKEQATRHRIVKAER